MTESEATLAARDPRRTSLVGAFVAYGEPAVVGFLISLPVFVLAFEDRLASLCGAVIYATLEVVEAWWKIRRARQNPDAPTVTTGLDPPRDSAMLLGEFFGCFIRWFLLVYVVAFVVTRDHEVTSSWALVLGSVLAIKELWHDRRKRLVTQLWRRVIAES